MPKHWCLCVHIRKLIGCVRRKTVYSQLKIINSSRVVNEALLHIVIRKILAQHLLFVFTWRVRGYLLSVKQESCPRHRMWCITNYTADRLEDYKKIKIDVPHTVLYIRYSSKVKSYQVRNFKMQYTCHVWVFFISKKILQRRKFR